MINALRYKERLEESGFTPEQAKNSVDIWMSLINENFATKADMREFQLVNKSELKDVQVQIQSDMKDMRSDLEGQIKDLKSDLEGQIKDLKSDLEGQIKDLRLDLEGQIKDLRAEMKSIKTEVIFTLGGLMIGLFTISTTIISILISRM